MSDAVPSLQRLGLSKYEAEVFVALREIAGGTARDVAAVADVPRSQVYGAADDLAERGLVDVQHATPRRFRAVSLDVARERLREEYEREFDRAFEALEAVEVREAETEGHPEELWTVGGSGAIRSRAEELVRDAESEVLYGSDASLLEDDLAAALRTVAADRAVTVVSTDPEAIDAFDGDPVETVSLPDAIEPADWPAGRVLVVDGDTILLSMLEPGDEETAFWSSDTAYAEAEIRLIDSWLREFVDLL